jgi:ketosteroid isomerase-like protein
MTKADNENERVVVDFLTTLSTGNLAKVREMLHEQATWTPMVKDIPGAGVHRGKAGIVDEFLTPIRGMFKPGDPKVTITSLASKGPLVICETIGKGTVADGRPYDNQYCWAFEVRDGKVFAIREYMDSLYVSNLFFPK